MSTTTRVFHVPAGDRFDDTAYQGSIQQVLADNIGDLVSAEFLVGANNIEQRTGVLEAVGVGYLVLYDETAQTHIVCDLYAVKFVTFFPADSRLELATSTLHAPERAEESTAPMDRLRRMSHAAYEHARQL